MPPSAQPRLVGGGECLDLDALRRAGEGDLYERPEATGKGVDRG